MTKKVLVYVDGFNMYHGLCDCHDNTLKWLDLWKLGQSLCAADEVLVDVYYFSAYATWKGKDVEKRHRDYVRALTSRGVKAVMGKFKAKPARCNSCGQTWSAHEEKETDVHIAIQIIHDAHLQSYDKAILITGDTDQAPTIKKAKAIHPLGEFEVWTPPNRNRGCSALGVSKEIRKARIANCQLDDRVLAPDGSLLVERPVKYRTK